MTPLLLAAAGGLGAALRFVVDGLVRSRAPQSGRLSHFPWGTWVINVSGSFGLGLLLGLGIPDQTRLIWGTGLLGGYTTFSTASFEVAERLLDGRRVTGLVTAFVMAVTCVSAAGAGVWAGLR